MAQALLVIDVQNDVVDDTYRRDEVVANIATLVEQARERGTPVIWVRHNDPWLPLDTHGWHIVPELHPSPEEPHIDKQYRSCFETTDLAEALGDATELIVCGAETNYCIRHTIHAGLERGYSIILVADAHTCTAQDAAAVIAEQNENCAEYRLPGRTCVVKPTDAVFTTRPTAPRTS